MEESKKEETETSAELGQQLKAMDEEIERCWARVQELRKQRPALLAKIIDLNRKQSNGTRF